MYSGSTASKENHLEILDEPRVTPIMPNMSCCSHSAGVKAVEVLGYAAL